MNKINKSDSNGVYNFSFSLKTTNPFERAVVDRLKELIENGCSKKEAIMTLMAKSVMDNFNLDAPACESVQFREEQAIEDKAIADENITMAEKVEVTESNQIEFTHKEVSSKSQNQQIKIVESEQEQVNNEATKKLSDDKQRKIQALLKGVYEYGK